MKTCSARPSWPRYPCLTRRAGHPIQTPSSRLTCANRHAQQTPQQTPRTPPPSWAPGLFQTAGHMAGKPAARQDFQTGSRWPRDRA